MIAGNPKTIVRMKIKSRRDGLAARFQETRLWGGEQVLAVYQGAHFSDD